MSVLSPVCQARGAFDAVLGEMQILAVESRHAAQTAQYTKDNSLLASALGLGHAVGAGRWVLADQERKVRRVRTVPIPGWVKQGISAWITAPRAWKTAGFSAPCRRTARSKRA